MRKRVKLIIFDQGHELLYIYMYIKKISISMVFLHFSTFSREINQNRSEVIIIEIY